MINKKRLLIILILISSVITFLFYQWLSSIHYYSRLNVERKFENCSRENIKFICPKLTFFSFAIGNLNDVKYQGNDVRGTLTIYGSNRKSLYIEKIFFDKKKTSMPNDGKIRLSTIFTTPLSTSSDWRSVFVVVLKPGETYFIDLSLNDVDGNNIQADLYIIGCTYRKFKSDFYSLKEYNIY